MSPPILDLWSLVDQRPQIDPQDLAQAIVFQAEREPLDYRTRLLIRDSVGALRNYWGDGRVDGWLARSSMQAKIQAICREEFDKVGFPSLRKRLMDKTDPEKVKQYLRELSQQVRSPLRIVVGGAIAVILPGLLVRHTEDIDLVDEVPKELRENYKVLENLHQRYGLELRHFQSHYLPTGWETRLHYHDSYGNLTVYLIDEYDFFLGKLFSVRLKDLDDLRVLLPALDKEVIRRRFRETTQALQASPEKEKAENNWFILFGEPLPS